MGRMIYNPLHSIAVQYMQNYSPVCTAYLSQDDINGADDIEPVLLKDTLCRGTPP